MRNDYCLQIRRGLTAIVSLMLFVGGPLLLPGCGGGVADGQTGPTTPTNGDQTTETDDSTTTFKGIVAGTVSDSRSTRESLDTAEGEIARQILAQLQTSHL